MQNENNSTCLFMDSCKIFSPLSSPSLRAIWQSVGTYISATAPISYSHSPINIGRSYPHLCLAQEFLAESAGATRPDSRQERNQALL